jgi:hypothetical protein
MKPEEKLEQLIESQKRDYPDLEILSYQCAMLNVDGHSFPLASVIYKCETPTGDLGAGTHVQVRWAIRADSQAVTNIGSWFEKEDDAGQKET